MDNDCKVDLIRSLKSTIAFQDRMIKEVEKEIESLRADVERLSSRDGTASIYLCFGDEENPFHKEELKVVDFGVSDNDYIVESEAVNALRARLNEKDEVLQELQTKLAEAEKDSARYRKLQIFMSLNTKETWHEVENLASLGCWMGLEDFNMFLDNSKENMPTCGAAIAKGEE